MVVMGYCLDGVQISFLLGEVCVVGQSFKIIVIKEHYSCGCFLYNIGHFSICLHQLPIFKNKCVHSSQKIGTGSK